MAICSRKDICILFAGLKLSEIFLLLLMLELCLFEMNISSYISMEVHSELKCVIAECFTESRCK